jgi:hypothetical protein
MAGRKATFNAVHEDVASVEIDIDHSHVDQLANS